MQNDSASTPTQKHKKSKKHKKNRPSGLIINKKPVTLSAIPQNPNLQQPDRQKFPAICNFIHENYLFEIDSSKISHREIIKNDTQEENKLGDGNFGTVVSFELLGKSLDSNDTKNLTCAIKKLPAIKDGKCKSAKYQILEADIAKKSTKLGCQFTIKYFGAIYYNHSHQLWLIMEKMDICLCKFIKRSVTLGYTIDKIMNLNFIKKLTFSLIEGLKFLKDKLKIIHRDIKPSNTLIRAADSTIKICDFGIAANLVASKRTYIGTAVYMSPERCVSSPSEINDLSRKVNKNETKPENQPTEPKKPQPITYDDTCDVWSVGMTVGETINGKFLYDNKYLQNHMALILQISDGESPTISDKVKNLHIEAYDKTEASKQLPTEDPYLMFDFIERKCLIKNVRKNDENLPIRPNYNELGRDVFYKNICESRWDQLDLRNFIEEVLNS